MIPYKAMKEDYPDQSALDTMGIDAALVKLAFDSTTGRAPDEGRRRAFPFRAKMIDVSLSVPDFKTEDSVTVILVDLSPAAHAGLITENPSAERTKICTHFRLRSRTG